ncbi:MAG TPA: YetF domain-containing protein [Cyclobacteriaceae bacterium]|nr:YetF domain-containing protein [Cyclobacteriaceae bacterium]
MDKIFFDNWESIFRTFIISILAYIALVLLLRISGKRTLSKMNAFDFIVTIALGSTLATVLLNKDVALADGVLAFTVLILLQYVITYFSARSKTFSDLVKSTPSLLVYKGKMLENVMKKERIAKDEIFALVREKGLSNLEEVDAIVLETDGSLTLIKEVQDMKAPTMSFAQQVEGRSHVERDGKN